MDDDLVRRIATNPDYIALKAKRSRFGWTLAVMMLVVYYGFIGLIAFDKAFLARPQVQQLMTPEMQVAAQAAIVRIPHGHGD